MDRTGSKRIKRFENTVGIHLLSCKSKKKDTRETVRILLLVLLPTWFRVPTLWESAMSLRIQPSPTIVELSRLLFSRISFPFSFVLLDSRRLPSFSFRLFPPSFYIRPRSLRNIQDNGVTDEKTNRHAEHAASYFDISSLERRTLRYYPKFEHDPYWVKHTSER